MYVDQELKALRRKVHLQSGLVLALALIITLNIGGLLAGAIFYNEFCVSNTRISLERFNKLKAELENGKKTKHWQDVEISSQFGYPLKGTYLPNPTPSENTVIFVHGISSSRLMGLWYYRLYFDAGFNVLIYDSRAHGDSGGSGTTWGYYEKYDLDQWVNWVKARHPTGIIGIHGVSMGGATALEHTKLNEANKRVNFYVADSAYADLEDLLTQQIDAAVHLHSPLWIKILLKYSSAAAYIEARFRYDQVSPVHSVTTATTPILYLHGEADPLVPVTMAPQLYDATKGYRELHTFYGVGHAMAVFERKAEYRRTIYEFMNKVVGHNT